MCSDRDSAADSQWMPSSECQYHWKECVPEEYESYIREYNDDAPENWDLCREDWRRCVPEPYRDSIPSNMESPPSIFTMDTRTVYILWMGLCFAVVAFTSLAIGICIGQSLQTRNKKMFPSFL